MRTILAVVCCVGVVLGLAGTAGAQTTLWRCDVTMRDGAADALRSDAARTGTATYTDGEGGFVCAVSASGTSGTQVPGSGTFYFGRKPTRTIFFPQRPGSDGWKAVYGTPQLRVLNIADMSVGQVTYRALRIPQSPIGLLYAEDLGDGDPVVDIVRVERIDACAWQVSFDPDAATPQGGARMQRYATSNRYLGAPVMQLGYTLVAVPDASGACPS